MSLGTPTGNARMAAVAMVVPADPPRPRTPASRPSRCRPAASLAAPFAASATARPRSPAARTDSSVVPAAANTVLAGDVRREGGRAEHAGVEHRHGHAGGAEPVADVATSGPLVSSVAISRTDMRVPGHGHAGAGNIRPIRRIGPISPMRRIGRIACYAMGVVTRGPPMRRLALRIVLNGGAGRRTPGRGRRAARRGGRGAAGGRPAGPRRGGPDRPAAVDDGAVGLRVRRRGRGRALPLARPSPGASRNRRRGRTRGNGCWKS